MSTTRAVLDTHRDASPDPADWSVARLVDEFRRKTLSPVEVTRAALARIDRWNPTVNAFCIVDPDRALAAARDSERRWMAGEPRGCVDGVPATVKDLLSTAGWPTRRGSLTVSVEGPWVEDAPVVAHLRRSGAVLIGKTTTSEFGWKGVTDSPLTGVTRNPWSTDRTPGGSSGGAAAAAALGMGTLHLGTDAGGSIRVPAAFTGVFGLKPTYGRTPAFPRSAFGGLSHIGPLTRSVEDAAWMMRAIASPDARDWLALPEEPVDYRLGCRRGVQGLRVAYAPTLGHATVDPDVARQVAAAVAGLERLGARVDQVDRVFDDPIEAMTLLWDVGAARVVRRLDERELARLDPGLGERAEVGRRVSIDHYLDALATQDALGHRLSVFHGTCDVLITPAVPCEAFAAGALLRDPSRERTWLDWSPFTYPFNLTQQPACSVPCGFTGAGLPVGVQIVGPRHGDALVLQVAAAVEATRPPTFPAAPYLAHQTPSSVSTTHKEC